MLRGQVRLGRIFDIEIGLHFSWFIIAVALKTHTLATARLMSQLRRQTATTRPA